MKLDQSIIDGESTVVLLALAGYALWLLVRRLSRRRPGLAIGRVVAAAVYDVAGPRAALIAGWLIALEPTNIFFSSIIHREPLLLSAEGLISLGAVRMWTKRDLGALPPLVLGLALATATRPYVGWF